jgi:hypothetical protein
MAKPQTKEPDMKTKEKFETALRKIAEDRDLDLVIEHSYANIGHYAFQPRDSFEPVIRFPFDFQHGYSNFATCADPEPLGRNQMGGRWSGVRGGAHDQILTRVKAKLDGTPDAIRYLVSSDGDTVARLEACSVYEVPADWTTDDLAEAITTGSVDGREAR